MKNYPLSGFTLVQNQHPGLRVCNPDELAAGWGGTGYPHGLNGEDFHMEERIVKLADQLTH
jgi:response regulator RpfG family c-di-GMP phosphodiesterase